MINKSKKDWAYTLIDVESKITDEIVDELKEIEGIVKVRVLK
jgi:D-3-phosphoglycerate dehydrogenase